MEPTNQGKIQEHLGEVVRSTVEETLNAMLDAEADRLCRAERRSHAFTSGMAKMASPALSS